MIRPSFLCASTVAAALLLAGCGKKAAGPGLSEQRLRQHITEKELPDEGLVLVEVDTNRNGSPDVFNYYRERADAPRLLVKKEVDLNGDGQVDVISYFDGEGALEKEETDEDFDNRFDKTDYYREGRRVMQEIDTDHDSRPNIFKYYAKSDAGGMRITHEERDEDGNGLIDFWMRFDVNGSVVKTGRDTNGDGKMDVREE